MTPEECKALMDKLRGPFELKHTEWLDVGGIRVEVISRAAVTERLDSFLVLAGILTTRLFRLIVAFALSA